MVQNKKLSGSKDLRSCVEWSPCGPKMSWVIVCRICGVITPYEQKNHAALRDIHKAIGVYASSFPGRRGSGSPTTKKPKPLTTAERWAAHLLVCPKRAVKGIKALRMLDLARDKRYRFPGVAW